MNTKDMAQSLSQAFIDEVAQNIAELCDRDSPEEYPDCMLVTYAELNECMHAVHEDVPAVDYAPLLSRIAELEARLEAAKLARIALVAFNAWHRDNDLNYETSKLKDYYSNTIACFIATDKQPEVQHKAAIDAAIRGNE